MPEEQSPRPVRPLTDHEILDQKTQAELMFRHLQSVLRPKPSENLMLQGKRRKIAQAASSKPAKAALTVSTVALLMVIMKPLYERLRRITSKGK